MDRMNLLKALVMEASDAILRIYEGEFSVVTKEDGSPLTRADCASHNILVTGLQSHFPDIPVISEETQEDTSYGRRSVWDSFWLVDPLDGTKEFVKRNGEFTVNVALIEASFPVLGLISVPAKGTLYYAVQGQGAWRTDPGMEGHATRLSVRRRLPDEALTVVKSRSHPSPELEKFLSRFPIGGEVSAGSALKFCMVAEGAADLYPRLGPTMEWDTAAGQAIVEEAGGSVLDLEGNRFRYNKESLTNGPFYVKGGFQS